MPRLSLQQHYTVSLSKPPPIGGVILSSTSTSPTMGGKEMGFLSGLSLADVLMYAVARYPQVKFLRKLFIIQAAQSQHTIPRAMIAIQDCLSLSGGACFKA